MTTTELRPAAHSTFRIERFYEAPPSRVFFAFSDTESKRRWFAEGEGFTVLEVNCDFRLGGKDVYRFRCGESPEILNETIYQDIVPDRRIVFAYRMAMAGGLADHHRVHTPGQRHFAGPHRAGRLSRRLR